MNVFREVHSTFGFWSCVVMGACITTNDALPFPGVRLSSNKTKGTDPPNEIEIVTKWHKAKK